MSEKLIQRIAELEANVTELEVEACRDELVIRQLESQLAEHEWVSVIENESWDIRCVDVPTGGDDFDIDWIVIEHYMEKPNDREIGRGKTPAEAVKDAIDNYLPEVKPSHAGSCEHAFHKGNPCTCQPELPEAMRPILQDLVDSDVYQEVKKEIESPEPAVEVCEWKVDVDNGGFTTDCGYRHTKMHFTPTCPYCKLEIKEEG